jgi:hypothetical protein
MTDLDTSTPLRRAFAALSSGFPVENLFEPDAGAVGRTSAANPFEYVLRCCGPQRASDLVLHAEVERTAAAWRNFVGRGGVAVSATFGSAPVKAVSLSLTVASSVSIALSIFDQGIEFARHCFRCALRYVPQR